MSPVHASAIAAVREVAGEHAARHDEAASFPVEALTAMRRTGLLGLLVPARYGGMDGGLLELVEAGEALAREDLSTALIFVMHCQQVAALACYADNKLAVELMPRIACGDVYLASITTEPDTSGHLLRAASGLREAGTGLLRLEREAPVVTGGGHADGFLVTTRVATAAPTAISLVYADRTQLEIAVAGDWQPLGMRATDSRPLRLTGTVPRHQVVGSLGNFREVALNVFAPTAHLGWAACWLGAAAGALSRTVRHLRGGAGTRGADPTSELLLARLARVRSRLDTVNGLLRHTLDIVAGRGRDLSLPSVQLLLNTLKIVTAEQCHIAVDELIALAGMKLGYLRGSPLRLERALRDLRSAPLNYDNDRLLLANGRLSLLDPEVRLA